jgi:predicted metalloprotease with PDZ domain
MHTAHEVEDHALNLQYSLGFGLSLDGGAISDIVPGSPADAAGMAPGSHLVAVDGHRWSADTMHEALAGGGAGARPVIALLVEKDDEYRNYELSYAGGERYPNLVRDGGADLLAAIARPRAPAAPEAR